MVGTAFVYASIPKVCGRRFFYSEDIVNTPVGDVAHFFEILYQAGPYWRFLGLTQLIAGLLLLTQRFGKLSSCLSAAVVSNILMISLSFNDFRAQTPMVAWLLFWAVITLLIWEWNELRILVNLRPIDDSVKRCEADYGWELIGVAAFCTISACSYIQGDKSPYKWYAVLCCLALSLSTMNCLVSAFSEVRTK
jgi:hypothetical protein